MSEGRIGGESLTNGMEEFDWLDVGEARYSLSRSLSLQKNSLCGEIFGYCVGITWARLNQFIRDVQKYVKRFRLKFSPLILPLSLLFFSPNLNRSKQKWTT